MMYDDDDDAAIDKIMDKVRDETLEKLSSLEIAALFENRKDFKVELNFELKNTWRDL